MNLLDNSGLKAVQKPQLKSCCFVVFTSRCLLHYRGFLFLIQKLIDVVFEEHSKCAH